MFIFWQIYEGIEITINSLILLAKFLIQHKKSYILTVKLRQDPPEFLWSIKIYVARKDNPTLYDFGYNYNSIRNQKIFR